MLHDAGKEVHSDQGLRTSSAGQGNLIACFCINVSVSTKYSPTLSPDRSLGPYLTFFPAARDYSIMLKAGCSCLFSRLYLCRRPAVTKYMVISHSSTCNVMQQNQDRWQIVVFLVFKLKKLVAKPLFFFLSPKFWSSYLSLDISFYVLGRKVNNRLNKNTTGHIYIVLLTVAVLQHVSLLSGFNLHTLIKPQAARSLTPV